MFENEKVNHVKFGEGSVMECDGSHIRIVFSYNNVEKTFAYPGAFDKFVTFQSKDKAEPEKAGGNEEAYNSGERETERGSTQGQGEEKETVI